MQEVVHQMKCVLCGFVEGGKAFLYFVRRHFPELPGQDFGEVLEPIQGVSQFVGDDGIEFGVEVLHVCTSHQ